MPRSSLVSYAKRDILEQIPGMLACDYFLPASKNEPTILHVADSFYYKPDLDGNNETVFVPSEQIVKSVVHMHITSQLGYKVGQHPALFAVPNESVSVESLKMPHYAPMIKEALDAQKAWFIGLVKLADDDWQQLKRHGMISDIQRTAARELGLKRDWLFVVESEADSVTTALCPFCGTGLLNENAPICPSCGKVHNPKRMQELEKMLGIAEVVKK